MHYYEVLLADSSFHGGTPLTYSYNQLLPALTVVSVPLRNRLATGFVMNQVSKPSFAVRPIKSLQGNRPLPFHCVQLAQWIKEYYSCTLSEALRQFAPSTKATPRKATQTPDLNQPTLSVDSPLTPEQKTAIKKISSHPSTTVLLHGQTGSGKTRVYLELAKKTISSGHSVIMLTPEIALTAQLEQSARRMLNSPTFVIHSELTAAKRKKLWLDILQAKEPIVVIGPRSALYAPVNSLGLVIVDEAHEPAYKQEQAPRYHASRVASQLGVLTSSRVVLGSATPAVSDYYLAKQREAVVEMKLQAVTGKESQVQIKLVDLKDKTKFRKNHYLSDELIDDINTTINGGGQALLFFNRRGSARLVMCDKCGWQLLCPNCDVPLVYHADNHHARCHICGYRKSPPAACPNCANPDVVYRSIGTKTLTEMVQKLFPGAKVGRFDSDSEGGERIDENYQQILKGSIDILVGTQLLAKGLDLPKLALVGIVSAETSLTLPDYTAEERTFQLLYQVIGRVGRGHTKGKVIVQTYDPTSKLIRAAVSRDYQSFYNDLIEERQTFRFPPFSYLLRLVCKRATLSGAENAANNLRRQFLQAGLPVEVIGPTPSFYARRGKYFYWQLVVKSKDRSHLMKLASRVPAGWMIDLDPIDLL